MNKFIASLFLVITLAFFSCRSTKKTATTTSKDISQQKTTSELIKLLKQNEFNFSWLSAKIDAETNIDSSKMSFNITLRAKKDSIIWMSISPLLGIEVARALITKDSVKFINRLNSSFFCGDFNYISKLLHTDLDYELIQSLLVGNSVAFNEQEDQLNSFKENEDYVLSTTRKKKLKKAISKNKELKDPLQTLWIDPISFKIKKILFKDFDANRTFNANFTRFNKIDPDSVYLPYNLSYDILAEKKIAMTLNYSKVTINSTQTFPFTIPDKYERIRFKE